MPDAGSSSRPMEAKYYFFAVKSHLQNSETLSQIYIDCSCIDASKSDFTYSWKKIDEMNFPVGNLLPRNSSSPGGGFAVAG